MSLVIHYWIDVQDSQGVSASERTYIASGGALNSTHSLTVVLVDALSNDVAQYWSPRASIAIVHIIIYRL